MADDFDVRVGAVGMPVEIEVVDDETGQPVDLAGKTVEVRMINPDKEVTVYESDDVEVDEDYSIVSYVTAEGQFPERGKYQVEVWVTSGASTLPSKVMTLHCGPSIAAPAEES